MEPLDSTEIYDPATGDWSKGPRMAENRWKHQSVRLMDGRVLAIEGQNDFFSLVAEAEAYDAATGTWSPAGAMSDARAAYGDDLQPLHRAGQSVRSLQWFQQI